LDLMVLLRARCPRCHNNQQIFSSRPKNRIERWLLRASPIRALRCHTCARRFWRPWLWAPSEHVPKIRAPYTEVSPASGQPQPTIKMEKIMCEECDRLEEELKGSKLQLRLAQAWAKHAHADDQIEAAQRIRVAESDLRDAEAELRKHRNVEHPLSA
jgi:hypothetical protein